MRLVSMSIENYRGVRQARHIPMGSMSIFVGKNDAGKSIVLNAIATFLNVKEYPIDDIDFNDRSKPVSLEGRFTSDNLKEVVAKKIGTKIKKDEGKEEFILDICANNELAIRRVTNKAGKAFDESLLSIIDFDHEDFEMLHQKNDEELNMVMGKYTITVPVSGAGRNSKLEKIKHIKQYCQEKGVKTKTIWIPDEYDIGKLLPEIELFKSDYGIEADTAFKTSSVTEVKGVFEEELREKGRLTDVAQKVATEMGKESQAISTLMKEYVPNVRSVTITPNFVWKDAIKSVDVNFEFDDDSKPINMTRKGSGYRRLFMVARFRYLALKKKGEDVLYAIEEPETFLHPSAQQDLLEALADLSKDNQVVLATHSPVFAGSSDKSSVVLCEKTEDGSKYSTETDDPDIPKRIIKELGIRPQYNMRDRYSKILFCESKNDIRFYDAVSNMLLGKGIIDNPDILALPGGGDSLEDIINIDYFTETSRSLYLLIDSDKHQNEKKQQSNKQRLATFNNLENAKGYILNKACIENYYHPKAFERTYPSLPSDSCPSFKDDDNVKEMLKDLMRKTDVQIKVKNCHDVFNETTKTEWEEIIEPELVDFLRELVM